MQSSTVKFNIVWFNKPDTILKVLLLISFLFSFIIAFLEVFDKLIAILAIITVFLTVLLLIWRAFKYPKIGKISFIDTDRIIINIHKKTLYFTISDLSNIQLIYRCVRGEPIVSRLYNEDGINQIKFRFNGRRYKYAVLIESKKDAKKFLELSTALGSK